MLMGEWPLAIHLSRSVVICVHSLSVFIRFTKSCFLMAPHHATIRPIPVSRDKRRNKSLLVLFFRKERFLKMNSHRSVGWGIAERANGRIGMRSGIAPYGLVRLYDNDIEVPVIAHSIQWDICAKAI